MGSKIQTGFEEARRRQKAEKSVRSFYVSVIGMTILLHTVRRALCVSSSIERDPLVERRKQRRDTILQTVRHSYFNRTWFRYI